MEIFYTSDLHMNHQLMSNIRGYSTKEEMNEEIIETWNSVVKPKDYVRLLGDVFFGNSIKGKELLYKLNGNISLILGNHDDDYGKYYERFLEVELMKYIKIPDMDAPNGKYRKVVLCHYPLTSWRSSNHGSFHFHGHTHGSLHSYGLNRVDAGWDVWKKPVPYEDLKEKILNCPMIF